VVADNLVLRDVAKIMDERLIARDKTNSTGITEDAGTVGKQERESNTTQGSNSTFFINSTSFVNSTPFISSFWVLAIVLGMVMYTRRK